MIVTAYWTKGTPYEAEAAALRETLEEFGLRHDIRSYPHPGNWTLANLLSAQHIRAVREDWPNEPILYLDADARVLAPPTLVEGLALAGYDAAFFFISDGGSVSIPPNSEALCSGTTWWSASPAATAMLDAWVALNRLPEERRGCDQLNLEAIVRWVETNPLVKIFRLRPEYCWIDDISARLYPKAGEVVIRHTQASRRYKHTV